MRPQPSLFEPVPDRVTLGRETPPSPVADTSLAAYARIVAKLPDLDWDWLIEIYQYLAATQYTDATAGELAEYFGVRLTTIRPRLTSLKNRKLLEFMPARESRGEETIPVHPYRPTLPRAAVERARRRCP